MPTKERRTPRYPFYASAEVTESSTQTKISARTSELSRFGCYLDMLNPFPIGMSVNIVIRSQEQAFEAQGRVIYSQRNMGMGVAFDAAKLESSEILEKWLEGLKA
jgi:PilZ domain